MKFTLDALSTVRLNGVHPDLVKVVQDCAANNELPFSFGVSEGLRGLAQQRANILHGVSWTLDSRHLDGHAVDLVVLLPPNHQICWAWPAYHQLAAAMKTAAERCGVPLDWGGDWQHHPDGPHFELPRDNYPGKPVSDVVTA